MGSEGSPAVSRRGRPSVARVDRQAIIEAALGIVDLEGPSALNMRRLAKALDLDSQSSLYNYFRNKGDLEVAVVRQVMAQITPPKTSTRLDWRQWVVDAAAAYHLTLLRHPRAIPLILDLRPRNFGARVFAFATKLMSDSGVEARDTEDLFTAIESLAAGSAWNAAAEERRGEFEAMTTADRESRHAELDEWFRRTSKVLVAELDRRCSAGSAQD